MSAAAAWVLECSAKDQAPLVFKLPVGEFVLGREPSCHVIIVGKQVSRRHARVVVSAAGVTLEDLGSFNGTLLAGSRIQKAALRGGEKVTVGEWAVLLRKAVGAKDAALPVPPPPPAGLDASTQPFEGATSMVGKAQSLGKTQNPDGPSHPAAGSAHPILSPQLTPAASLSLVMPALQVQWRSGETLQEPLRERQVAASALLRRITQHTTPLGAHDLKAELGELAQLARQKDGMQELALRLVYKAASDLQTARGEEDFLCAMADTILNSIRAQSVAVLLCPTPAGDFNAVMPRVFRTAAGSSEAARFSRSVVEQVLLKRVSITTEDATTDARFARNVSVLDLDLKAVLAVPMLREDVPVGVIYVTRKIPFFEWEEDLVAAVGHLTAVGLERALLKERVAQEESLRRTLERFHTREVVEKLMQSQHQEKGGGLFLEPITATVVFCDLCGFTQYCDQHTSAQVGELLNSYLGEMTRVVYEFRGTVDKYIGDAVMAVFGAPFPAADDAVRGTQCAVAMQKAFGELMALRPPEEQLLLRVGVNTGPVVAGTVGSALRMEYTCLGDTVNVAQRLESVAPHGGILLGKATAHAVEGVLKTRSRGTVNLKGKAEAVEVFELDAADAPA